MKVRFGIIGLGGIANRFASVLNTAEGVELHAVAASDEKRAVEFAEKHGAVKASKSYLELIGDKDVDVIYISLTHNFHYDMIKLCLEHGKSVICEKPMVLHQKEAEELASLAGERNVLLMEAMWSRFTPAFIKAREWVKGNRIGQVRLINASFCFNVPFDPKHRLYNPELAGGSLYDAGVYPIEFATGIMGESPLKVTGVASICKTGVDDYAAFSMSFRNGALASLSCGFTAATSQDAYVYGTEGHIIVHSFLGSRKCELLDKNNNVVESFETSFDDGFIFEILHFAGLYRDKKTESEIIPLKDTIACAGIFDELMRQWGLG
ncbi:MAG TPA: Gfo/Idh/MocA family oxidoreductase [Clostridia bacterium]|nr:Gfo/Idh/MocA family oxidoreductase [Clostridia bacterium]